jgi:hypothetical protein
MSGESTPGRGLVVASMVAAAAHAVVSVLAVGSPAFGGVFVLTAVAMFLVGLVAFAAALVVAAGRSRTDELSVMGLYLLSGSAPPTVRGRLLGALAVETAVALGVASMRPNTTLAFGVLVPTLGIGLAGLWAARHGTFPPRVAPTQRARRR